MIRPFLDDPLFEGIPRPGLTGSHGLTDITFAGQRHVMPLRGLMEKATGPDGISQREEREMAKSRRADNKPETAKDKRFFDLRESGETRPVDQGGNVVEDMDQWISDHS